MKRLAKILGGLVLVVALCIVGLIALVEFQSHRSQRQVVAVVAQLSPGTPYSAAVHLLGQPTQTLTNSEDIVSWVANVGSRIDAQVATNSLLHTFVHQGPPFRYILVYTDRNSQRVVYADWCFM